MTQTFDFRQDIVLENEVVKLRPLQTDDFRYLVEYAVNEPEIWEYFTEGAAGEDNLRHFIESTVKNRADQKDYPFIVFDKRTKKYVGSTRFYHINLKHQTLLIGHTWYGKKYQGTGLNKHCKFVLLQYAFEQMGMERVEFQANAKNERSIYAMKSIGCVVEGVLRSYAVNLKGERRDSMVLSILKEEWFGGVKEKLEQKIQK